MARTVGIMGMGNVGSTVAHIIVAQGLADTLILYDRNQDKVNADTLDFQDAASLLSTHTTVINGQISDMKDCDIIISAIGRIDLIKVGNVDRFVELRSNAPGVSDLSKELKDSGFHGILLVITNPNDVITGLYHKHTGFATNKVLGTGTYLDTSRLKRHVGEALGVDPRSVSGYILGEHGDSQFAAWSTVRVEGRPFTEIAKEKGIDLDQLEKDTRFGGGEVHAGKGYTNYAVATAATSLVQIIFSDAKSEAICSHYNEDFKGYISSPAIIGKNGVERVLELPLTDEENKNLLKSAQTIKEKSEQFS
ncbi:lactate/malate family dehydrogenase [Xylocopilactobacillus apicola]|uniref:L-lactate dehydrogenase n=1 Tax=Xylocopilactobacillus apicola TaxID=2932184 RepID=A0AAU9CZY5_9LACO|nr:L-lactate dehydrogenase [Xylocopilactobacillus apicola]BDR59587.1 L-lactate dehydrogenase [Xylocopilactobacillus apicola]